MNIRETVYQILINVLINGQYANLVMRKAFNVYEPNQRHFGSAMVYGILRHYNQCLYWLKPYLRKSPKKKEEILLVMGVYQLKYMDVKSYVVIDQTVALAKPAYRGFINATLRAIDTTNCLPALPDDPIDALSIKTSLPKWLIQLWSHQYGFDQATSFANLSLKEATVFLRWNTLQIDPSTVSDPKIHPISDYCFTYDGNIMDSPYYHLGQCVIQDANSTQIVNAMDIGENMNILDCCAAPGSKTSQIAMLLHNTGHIDAVELHPHRVKLLQETLTRLGITNTSCITGSLLDQQFNDGYFDRILLDAPCSGLGVLSRRAEMRFHLKSESLDELQQLQKSMLNHVAPWLKPGGKLVYSTCTLNKKENEKQIQSFLNDHDDYGLYHQHTIFPNESDTDGFYYAVLVKRKL